MNLLHHAAVSDELLYFRTSTKREQYEVLSRLNNGTLTEAQILADPRYQARLVRNAAMEPDGRWDIEELA